MTALRRLVLLVAAVGLLVQTAAATLLAGAGPVLPPADGLAGLPAPALLLGALALAVSADLVHVLVRRGEQREDLTLVEVAIVLAVLVLPARDALWVPVAAVAVTSVLRRRQGQKALFNIGNHAASSAAFVAVVHLVTAPAAGLSARTVLALVLGLLAFSAVNLAGYISVLVALGEVEAQQVLRDGLRLAVVNATATVAVAGSAALAVAHAPALLPFSLVPVAALIIAFRTTARAAEDRQRAARLLALSQVLAGRFDHDEVLPAFLSQCRQAFGAQTALVVLRPWSVGPGTTTADRRGQGAEQRDTSQADLALLASAPASGGLLSGELPEGWTSAVAAPLEADGQTLGTLVLGADRAAQPLGEGDLSLLGPLACALAVALRGGVHLRRLTEVTAELQAVVDQSSDGILVLDGRGRVQLWSPALEALTGVRGVTSLGRPLSEVLPAVGPDGAPCDPAATVLLSPEQPQATVELTVARSDGEQRVVRCAHAAAYADGAMTRDVVLVHDVTRERELERLKADFVATVSHELRTPVTPIKGYADLLRRRGDEMTPERRQECLAIITDRCDHLARLVEDLLLASRISAASGASPVPVQLVTADLVPLVARAAADFGVDGERLRLALPPAPVELACDPVRVVQVLSNLISNALTYSAAGTPVDVALTCDGEDVHVAVADVGRGIPADQRERVFDKFHRVEDPLRMTTSGTGLGLYIARHLATAMGGDLRCSSTLGVGSVFVLQLPRTGCAPDAQPSEPPVADADRPLSDGLPVIPVPRGAPTASRSPRSRSAPPGLR